MLTENQMRWRDWARLYGDRLQSALAQDEPEWHSIEGLCRIIEGGAWQARHDYVAAPLDGEVSG